jgi:hypothetical protein
MRLSYQNNMMDGGPASSSGRDGIQGNLQGRPDGTRMMGNQGAVQKQQNDQLAQQLQSASQGRPSGHRPEAFFQHPHAGIIPAITIILLWTFLILGIVALAKSIFSRKEKVLIQAPNTHVPPAAPANTAS